MEMENKATEETKGEAAKRIAAKIGMGLLWSVSWFFILVLPIIVVLSYFPLWLSTPSKSVSGLSVFLIGIVCLVAWKFIRPRIPQNVSFLIWLFMFYGITLGILCAIRSILTDVILALALSACSTLAGALFYIIWEILHEDRKVDKENEK